MKAANSGMKKSNFLLNGPVLPVGVFAKVEEISMKGLVHQVN